MKPSEKKIIKEAVQILTSYVKEKVTQIPRLLWRDRQYVAIKITGLAITAWSVYELFYGSLDVYAQDTDVYTASLAMGLVALLTPSCVIQEVLTEPRPRRIKDEEQKEEEDV